MDDISSSLRPNMEFLLDLTPDQKIKYFELFHEAKENLREFSRCLKEMYGKHQRKWMK